MRKLLLASLASMLILAMTGARANHSWLGFHWARTANPFHLTLVDTVETTWDSLLTNVAIDWSGASVLNTGIQASQSGLAKRLPCTPLDKKIRVCNANYGPNLWFGQATVFNVNGHIARAVVQVNDFYFTGTYNNNVARRHVLCQEVGHTLGLDHVHGTGSCMDDDNATLNNTGYQYPNSHDYAELSTIYTHLDSFNSSQTALSSSPDRVEFINGETVLTFIDWVNR